MFKFLKSKEKVSKIIMATLLFITYFSSSAYALGKWTGRVVTPEGSVTKIYTDFSNPTWWPFQAGFILSVIFAIIFFLVDAKNIISDVYVKKEKFLDDNDIMKGKLPEDILEADNSITKGIAVVREADPNFSITDFIEQVDKLYRASIKGRLTHNWGGIAYSIPGPILMTLEKNPIKVTKYKPLIPEIMEIKGYTTGTDKAIVKFKGIGETKSESSTLLTYEEETWTLERFRGVPSQHTYDMTTCPKCGCKDMPDEDGQCPKCATPAGQDKNGWILTITDRAQTKPITSYQGTKIIDRKDTLDNTIIQPNLAPKIDWIKKRNPNFSEETMLGVVKHLVSKHYSCLLGETENNKEIYEDLFFRNAVIDGEMLKESFAKLQANISGIKIYAIKPTRVMPDPYMDILTYRVWGKIDVTIGLKGDKKECMFSDYITICRHIDRQDWKIWQIESPLTYRS